MRFARPTRGGFTLIEITITIGILTIAALMLTATIASSQQMSSLAREREIANNAIRSYIEQMRMNYPAQGSTDLTNIVVQGQYTFAPARATPLDFIPSSALEKGLFRNAVATVQFTNDERGLVWDHCYTTNAAIAPLSSTIMSGATAAAAAVPDDQVALGLPRDLDGDGAINVVQPIALNKLLLVPCKVELSWISGTGTHKGISNSTARQKVTVYVSFSAQH